MHFRERGDREVMRQIYILGRVESISARSSRITSHEALTGLLCYGSVMDQCSE
jgi:hypothetical protein